MVTVTPSSRSMSQPRTLTQAPGARATTAETADTAVPWQRLRAQALVTRLRLAGSPTGLAPVEELFLEDGPKLTEEVLGFLDAATAPLRFMVTDLLEDGRLHAGQLHRAFAEKGRTALEEVVTHALSGPVAAEAASTPRGPADLLHRRRQQAVLDALRQVATLFAGEAEGRAPGALRDHYDAMTRYAEARAADLQREMARTAPPARGGGPVPGDHSTRVTRLTTPAARNPWAATEGFAGARDRPEAVPLPGARTLGNTSGARARRAAQWGPSAWCAPSESGLICRREAAFATQARSLRRVRARAGNLLGGQAAGREGRNRQAHPVQRHGLDSGQHGR